MSNDPNNNSWRADLPTEDLSIAVNTQSTTETLRTSNLFSQIAKKYSFCQSPIHTERIEAVNLTLLHNSHVQTIKNNMSVVNQSTDLNMSVPQGNSPITSAEVTLNMSALQYNNDQLASPDLWDSLFALTSLLGINQFLSYNT